MKYISTRGHSEALPFEAVLLAGLAPDGGLYVPEFLPRYTPEKMDALRGLSYEDLATEIMYPFLGDSMSRGDFSDLVAETYADFSHLAKAPLKQISANEWLLELFHGPTLAFKDFALQLLGRLVQKVLERSGEQVVIMGATSGDTGSAAIEGCRHCDLVDLFILHPHQRVSEVQRRQMTTVIADNVHNLAIKGNFDDCQRMVKASFADQSFLKGRRLVAVNSINWCRIMAQIVYYFYAALRLGAPARSVAFSVPTGNFGDIFAGYLASRMGLPIEQLIVATNQNDILHRFFQKNEYRAEPLVHTLSPSMDIVVSSNFERLLFDLHGRDGAALRSLMERLGARGTEEGELAIEQHRWQEARSLFDSFAVSESETLATLKQVYNETSELLDPHTAIGVHAGRECRADFSVPVVTLATAHPAKFPEAVKKAGLTEVSALPDHLADLHQRQERYTVLDNELSTIQSHIAQTLEDKG